MKGFYITVKNGLLETKHHDKMGESVWLFMWYLDKMTSISEQGVGKVLGGKPIKYSEFNSQIKVSRKTHERWNETLRKEGYINTKRTPHGLIVTINKANKRYVKSDELDASKVSHQMRQKSRIRCDKNDASNKTVQYTTNSKTVQYNDKTKEKNENSSLVSSSSKKRYVPWDPQDPRNTPVRYQKFRGKKHRIIYSTEDVKHGISPSGEYIPYEDLLKQNHGA